MTTVTPSIVYSTVYSTGTTATFALQLIDPTTNYAITGGIAGQITVFDANNNILSQTNYSTDSGGNFNGTVTLQTPLSVANYTVNIFTEEKTIGNKIYVTNNATYSATSSTPGVIVLSANNAILNNVAVSTSDGTGNINVQADFTGTTATVGDQVVLLDTSTNSTLATTTVVNTNNNLLALFMMPKNKIIGNVIIKANITSKGINSNNAAILFNYYCLAATTKILMADGTEKMIKDIKRGDFVYGDVNRTIVNKVSRVNISSVFPGTRLPLIRISKGALGNGLPTEDIIGTKTHTFVWKGVRKPLNCFLNIKGVIEETGVVDEILPLNDKNELALYNLVFDHDANYVANGVESQAHSPYSKIGPLDKKDYFDKKNYRKKRSWRCANHPMPYDEIPIKPLITQEKLVLE